MLRLVINTSLSVSLVFISCATAISGTDLTRFSTCSVNGSNSSCNITCKATDSTNGRYDTPLLNATHVECRGANTSDVPRLAMPANGNIALGKENCTHMTYEFDLTSWTISFWAKQNGTQSRTLIEVRDRSNSATLVFISTSSYRVGGVNSTGTILQSDAWTFIVLRKTDEKAVYLDINGRMTFVGVVQEIEMDIQLLFGPQTNMSAYAVHIVDVRIYDHCLTGREVMKLFNGTLAPTLALQDNCLCPRHAPTVLPGPLNYGIFCTNHINTHFYRVNAAEFAVDGNENTYWESGTSSTNITLELKNIFQLFSVEINFGSGTSPSEMEITLTSNGKVSRNYRCGCTLSPCKINGGNFTYNMADETDLNNSTSYITLLADKVDIHLSGNCSNKTLYSISEIKIKGSCHCSGNSGSCIMPNGTDRRYNCSCTNVSKTAGNNCESCSKGFWRNSTFDLDCKNSCNCNTTGSNGSSCNEVDGNCYCKSNVQGQRCDACKYNSYNFSDNGCTLCKCNSSGITECNSTGQCVCKPNVEEASGTCNSCKPNHYGFLSGCTECGCNITGSQNQSCKEPSGQCYCRSYVTGTTCNTCKDGYWNLHVNNGNGCEECQCNIVVGSNNITCDKISGQCQCRDDVVTNRQCDPEIAVANMTPTYGPKAGGTKVTLFGKRLGNEEVDVLILLENIQMKIIGRTSTTIVFETMNATVGSADIKIKWLKKINEYPDIKEYTFPTVLNFDYRENAVILETRSKLQSFSSGWCNIELRGRALDSVYRPEIIVYGTGGEPNIKGTCNHTSGGTSILCKPPDMSAWVARGTYIFYYGVILDGITDFLNMTTSVIEIQPDPTFNTSGEIVYRNVFDKLITVNGEGFSRACEKRDFRLRLSKRGDCEIKDFTDTEITCDPKETFPGTGEKEALKIYIGDFEKDIGMVEFRTFWKLQEFIYICVGVGGFVLIVIIIIIISCICRQRFKSKKLPEDEMGLKLMRDPKQRGQENNYVGLENPMNLQPEKDLDKSYSELFLERLPYNVAELVKTSVIDKSHIEQGDICTRKGTYTRIINGKYASRSSTPYAGDGNTIKTLVENYPAQGEIPKWLSQGLQECTRLRDAVHEKVLRLRGIAIDEKKIYVVYPAIERTLKDYIQKNHGSQVINVDDVIAFCFDVGEGMKELHGQGIVHKDLAARNCMIDSGKVVKVADASFASDLYPEEYMKQLNRDLPVRWMAVESLQQTGFYDKATDMWSFGVLLWEVFTGCRYLPYQDLLDKDIHLNVVMQGYRLGKPENIPKPYLDILDQCMSTDNNLRPTFEAVLSLMNNALENPGEALYQNQEENYVNKTAIDHYMNKSAIDQSIQSDLPAPPPRKRIA